MRVERCTFRDNVAWAGGAIHSVMYQNPQALVVVDSTFLENRATGGNGGAIYHQDGSLTFTGSLVAGNRAFSIYPSGPNVTLSHLTVTRNHAGWTGDGITIAAPASNVTIRASIVAHNTAAHVVLDVSGFFR